MLSFAVISSKRIKRWNGFRGLLCTKWFICRYRISSKPKHYPLFILKWRSGIKCYQHLNCIWYRLKYVLALERVFISKSRSHFAIRKYQVPINFTFFMFVVFLSRHSFFYNLEIKLIRHLNNDWKRTWLLWNEISSMVQCHIECIKIQKKCVVASEKICRW